QFYNSPFYSKSIEVENISGEILVIITDSFGRESIYSWYDVEEKNSQSIYINKCLLGGFIKHIPKDVLIIGFGGGAFAKYLEDHIENVNITGIDIDKTMIDIAKNELQVRTNDFYIMDALEAIKILIKKKKRYDLILVDVYGGDGEIPKYFKDKSFFEDIQKLMLKDSVLSINFANYGLEDNKRIQNYDKIHSNLLAIFGKYYSHMLAGKNDRGNVIGIYNLDKFYEASDYNFNYLEKVQNGEIEYDGNIIQNTIVEETKKH
ncbi:MAG: methyltransferase domain-containing protein, partial [Candidatus Gracilibacteria bacterium]|nr:methyltransferase domain-containing protein [Candidatus Gracilibacteria bacterium]